MIFEKLFSSETYCINLKHRIDRWESASKEFLKVKISPIKFDAIENKENPAEGCRASHLAILKEAEKNNKNVFIFEDDVEFINENIVYLDAILEEIYYTTGWNMFYLGGNLLRPAYQISKYLARLSHCYSTHAYGVNKKFIPYLIKFIESNKNIPIDVLYGDYIVPNFQCYISVPLLCIQSKSYSDILGRNMDYSIPMARYEKYLIRKE